MELACTLSWHFPTRKYDDTEWEKGSSEQMLAGTPLANGLFGLVLGFKGDLEFFANSLKLRHHNSNLLCDWCPAERTEDPALCYCNFGPSSTWPTRLFTRSAWNGKSGK